MNQFFFESRGKDKVKELMNEGTMSQAHNRARSQGPGLLSRLPKLVLIVLGILWILQMIVR